MLLWKVLFVSSQNPSFRPSLKPHTPIIIKPQGWLSIQYYSSTDCSQASSSQGQFISVGVCITSSKGGLIYSVVIIDSENIQITRTKYSDSYCTSGTRNGYAQQTISTHSCLVSTSSWYSVLPLSEITGADFGKVSYLSQTAIPSGFYTGPATRYNITFEYCFVIYHASYIIFPLVYTCVIEYTF